MFLLLLGLDLDVGGGHAVFPDFFGGELPPRDLQAAESGAEVFHVAAGVNQGTERHVAANTRKTIEIGEFHGMPPCGWDCRLESLSAGCRLILSAESKGVKLERRLAEEPAGDLGPIGAVKCVSGFPAYVVIFFPIDFTLQAAIIDSVENYV